MELLLILAIVFLLIIAFLSLLLSERWAVRLILISIPSIIIYLFKWAGLIILIILLVGLLLFVGVRKCFVCSKLLNALSLSCFEVGDYSFCSDNCFNKFKESSDAEDLVVNLFKKGKEEQDCLSYEEAIKLYEESLKIASHEIILENKGYSLFHLGRFKESLKAYNLALEMNPKFTPALLGKANVLLKMGENEGARKCYQKILEFDPKNKIVKESINLVHYMDDVPKSKMKKK